MNKRYTKLLVLAVSALLIVTYLPKPTVSAHPDSIFIYGFGFESWDGRINPWPYPQQYYIPQLYEPNVTIQFQYIPVMGDFPGNDQVTIDCGNGTSASGGAGARLDNVWGHLYYVSYTTLSCTYAVAGVYAPVIHVVRTGNSGCGYNNLGWYTCWNTTGETATTDYGLSPFQIYPRNYNVNVYPDGYTSPYVKKAGPPLTIGFDVQVTFQPIGSNYANPVGGSFSYSIDCLGDGSEIVTGTGYANPNSPTEVMNEVYDSNYRPLGGGGEWAYGAFGTNSCTYKNAGDYRVMIGVNGGGASRTQYGSAEVLVFPSGPPAVRVTAIPSSGQTPLNDVDIRANVSGIMPAGGNWAIVSLTLRCDGNLPYEQAIAAGANPQAAQEVYGPDSQPSGGYTTSTLKTSSFSYDFTGSQGCSYSIAGTHTPTVVVQQNNLTGAGGTKVYAVGVLKCDGTDVLKAPVDYELEWNTDPTIINSCNAASSLLKSYSGVNYSAVLNWSGNKPISGAQVFYGVPEGNYQYNLTCVGSDPSKTFNASCPVQVTQ